MGHLPPIHIDLLRWYLSHPIITKSIAMITENRDYNILYHLHTVSGIVLSVLLFVICFAGSFAYFKTDILSWERNHTRFGKAEMSLNYDEALKDINQKYTLEGRDITITQPNDQRQVSISLSKSKNDSLLDETNTAQFFYIDSQTYEMADYEASYSLAEFIYRLHFFAQIPYPVGYYLSGFAALFFLFVIITGVLVHWKKIVSNFFVFRPWAKVKTMWTDAHTAIGIIGLPFQFVYAVTGAFFMIKVLLVAPAILVIYDSNQGKLYDDLGYGKTNYAIEKIPLETAIGVNEFVAQTKTIWDDFNVTALNIQNYGDCNMHLTVEGRSDYQTHLTATYKVATCEITEKKDPITDSSYLDGVKNVLFRLHFADYGGYALKIISFILGIMTCFVIISGVMIWLTARNKKTIAPRKRKANHVISVIYLAICLSMLPVTALAFIGVKIFSLSGITPIYSFYFITWLIVTIIFVIKGNNGFTNKYSLLSGGILAFLIPIVNGICNGNWLWISFQTQNFSVLFIDIFWIGIGLISLYSYNKIKFSKTEDT
jgi:uncharacterized iron-regulated membrane protein